MIWIRRVTSTRRQRFSFRSWMGECSGDPNLDASSDADSTQRRKDDTESVGYSIVEPNGHIPLKRCKIELEDHLNNNLFPKTGVFPPAFPLYINRKRLSIFTPHKQIRKCLKY